MYKKRILAAVVIAACLIGVVVFRYVSKPMEQYSATFLDVFHTSSTVVGYAKDEESFRENVNILKERLDYYHKLYDIYHTYDGMNNIKTINDQAGISPVKVDREIIELLLLSKEMYETTHGQINVAMGSVLSIWHEYRDWGISHPESASLPPMDQLQEAALHTDINKIIIDKETSTVYLEDSKMSIDVGSIGKGYAVEQVALYAKEQGMEYLLLNIGGNIRTIGSKANGEAWRLGIQNPDLESDESYVKRVEISDLSMVTSGDYQRYYIVDEKEYCHIIDPDTLMPAEEIASVSVITRDSGVADALSTSVFNMSLEEGMEFVNGLQGVEAIWILHDGSMRYSEHFEDYVIK